MDAHPIDLFDSTISTLSRSLDLRARNHEIILDNVANADTPNFRPFAMDVERALQNETTAVQDGSLARTDERHLAGQASLDDTGATGETAEENPLLLRGDHNGVDIDAEMAKLAKNSLLYRASAQIVGAKFSTLKNAITGGNK